MGSQITTEGLRRIRGKLEAAQGADVALPEGVSSDRLRGSFTAANQDDIAARIMDSDKDGFVYLN